MVPAAPVVLSMMNCWPSSLPMRSPTMRAIRSVGPPAAKGTMMVIGLLGQACAEARPAARLAGNAARTVRRNIFFSSRRSSPFEHRALQHAKAPGDQQAENRQHHDACEQLVGLHQAARGLHE